jgi:hypothetical protein
MRRVTFLAMMLHHGSRSHFFGASTISAASLRTLFDMFVLTLFLGTYASQVFLSWHKFSFRH